MTRIRILYVVTDLEVGGTERVVERLSTSLDRSRFEARVVALKGDGPVGKSIAAAGIPVINIGMRHAFDLGRLARLIREVDAFEPRVLHAFLFHANVIARFVGRLYSVPRILTTHRTLEGGPFHAGVERMTWRMSDEIICVSEEVRRDAFKRSAVTRSRVIGNGVPEPGGGEHPVDVDMVAASRIAPGKGLETFVKAAKIVGDALPQARFAIVGAGAYQGTVAEAALREGLGQRVRFPGAVSDVGSAIRGSRIFVHASELGEGMPNAVLEAMMAGVPVITTAAGTKGVIVDGENGFVVPPRDPAAVADRALRILRDPKLASALSNRAAADVRNRFSLAQMLREYERLYI